MHHYIQCGLDNVWLENGYTLDPKPSSEGISVENAAGLRAALVAEIIKKRGRISGKELRILRSHLAVSQVSLARCLGETEQSIGKWERTGKVPASTDALIRLLIIERTRATVTVTAILHRINSADGLPDYQIIAKETSTIWRTEIAAFNDQRFAIAN